MAKKGTAALLTLGIALALAAGLTILRMNAGASHPEAGPPGGPKAELPTVPTRLLRAEDRLGIDFGSLGQLAATSALLIRGSVAQVERGEPVHLDDSSGRVVIPRLIVVDVKQVLHLRGEPAEVPDQIMVNDGYWEDGEGYATEGVDWAQPGASGYFFLTHDRGPDLKVLPTYSLADAAGRVLFEDGHAEHADDDIWGPETSSDTQQEVSAQIAGALRDVRSGATKPVIVELCRPSDPEDENSEPICVKG